MNAENILISEFQQGKQKAFKQIYDLYKVQLYRFAHSFVNEVGAAEDITTECFTELWKKRFNFDNVQKIKSFLFISARHDCLDYLRRGQVHNKATKELLFLMENEEHVLTRMIKAEFLAQVYADIETLPPQCRQIFKMIYFEGLNYEEIASDLNLSQSTVRNQKMRALNLLKIKQQGIGDNW